MLKTILRSALIVPLLTIGAAALAAEPEPSATLTLEYTVFGVGVGISKGGGVLTLKNGAQYEFTLEGANVGTFGGGKVLAAGRVYNLSKADDFSGGYAAAGAGFAILVGSSISNLKNQRNDVRLVLQSTVEGLGIGLGASGTTIELGKMIKEPDPIPKATAMPKMTRKESKEYTLYFDFDSGELNAGASRKLATIVEEWEGHSAQVRLVGHTDTMGPMAYNQALSEKRALTVQQIMIEKGVPAFRLGSQGMGQTDLAVETPDNVARKLNRRVDIRFD